MEKLIVLGITYAAYLTMLFSAKKPETRRAIAISFTLISIVLSGFLFFGGVIFAGSLVVALAVALLCAGCMNAMIWLPYMFKKNRIRNEKGALTLTSNGRCTAARHSAPQADR